MADPTTPAGGADTLARESAQPAATQTSSKERIILAPAATAKPGDPSIRAFSFRATDEQLADLKRRIAACPGRLAMIVGTPLPWLR